MALSVATGVREVDAVLLRVGRSFHLTLWQTISKIYLPALVPPIGNGLKLGLGVRSSVACSPRSKCPIAASLSVMQYYGQFRILICTRRSSRLCHRRARQRDYRLFRQASWAQR